MRFVNMLDHLILNDFKVFGGFSLQKLAIKEKNNHLPWYFLIQKPIIFLLRVKNKWLNMFENLMNQKVTTLLLQLTNLQFTQFEWWQDKNIMC